MAQPCCVFVLVNGACTSHTGGYLPIVMAFFNIPWFAYIATSVVIHQSRVPELLTARHVPGPFVQPFRELS